MTTTERCAGGWRTIVLGKKKKGFSVRQTTKSLRLIENSTFLTGNKPEMVIASLFVHFTKTGTLDVLVRDPRQDLQKELEIVPVEQEPENRYSHISTYTTKPSDVESDIGSPL